MSPSSPGRFPDAVREANSHPTAMHLARYVDALRAGIAPAIPAETIAHVEGCRKCQEQILDVLFYLRDPLLPVGPVAIKKIFPLKKSRPNWLSLTVRIAAAAFVFIMMMTVYFSLPRRQAPPPSARHESGARPELPGAPPPLQVAVKESGREPVRNQALRPTASSPKKNNGRSSKNLDPFAANPNLESMVGSRSRGLVIDVYSPLNHVTLSRGITFAWKEFSHEPLSLIIVNNRNETIFTSPVSGHSLLLRSALPAGCFYWKLESASELYHVGKFFIPAELSSQDK